MTALVLIGLMVTCVKLWVDVGALRLRLQALEIGDRDEWLDRSEDRASSPRPTPPRAAPPPTVSRRVEVPEPTRPVEPVATAVTVPIAQPASASPPEPSQPPVRESARTVGLAPTPAQARNGGFEDLFGRKLPIWAGGVTLAVAGFLIVKYSIDMGLLSPAVRVVFGLLFGGGLIVGAEVALRADAAVRDPRVRQALSGAGVATLYASVLVAANLYHLVSPGTAFVGLVLTTALAGGLSLRFGAPSAVLGLIGGLAAPALVGSGPPDVPLLSAYIALAVGGLCALSRTQRWMWLGVGALAGGFGWGALLILGGTLDAAATLSVVTLLLLLGVGLPVLAFAGPRGTIVRAAGSLLACAQVAALVATGGFGALEWGLFALISIAILWLSRREAALADLPLAGLTIALLLVLAWPSPVPAMLAWVIGGIAAIYGAPAAWRVWRSDARLSDAGQIAAIAIAIVALPILRLRLDDGSIAALALLGAAAAAAVAAVGWRCATRGDDARFATLATTAAVLLALAIGLIVPGWAIAPVVALVAAGLLLLGERAADRRVEASAWALGLAAVAALSVVPLEDFVRAVAPDGHAGMPAEFVRWFVPALVAALFAWRGRSANAVRLAQPAAVLLGYVAAAQIVPAPFLPLVPAAMLAALGIGKRTLPALLATAVLTGAWAALPFGSWLAAGGGALVGFPMLVTALPSLQDTALRLAVAALASGYIATRAHRPRIHRVALACAALLATICAHIAFKHVFALADATAFVRLGMAERTLWEVLLAGVALAAWRRWPRVARGFAAASLAHFLFFTGLLHNPLWSEQAVGGWPVLNMLFPAYALAFGWTVVAARIDLPAAVQRARGWLQMGLILLFAASTLRQLVHGSLLVGGATGEGEDIARSVLMIALAVGFLRHGIARAARDWRLASLALMLVAVAKVFLLDAAGLDGLMRIASFAALGFSLIGLGWLYTRYLPESASLTQDSRMADMSAEGN